MPQVLKRVLLVDFLSIHRRCFWTVEDSAPGHPHEAWELNSSRRGSLCFHTRVHISDWLRTLLRFVSPFFRFDVLRFWFSYRDNPEYNVLRMVLRFKQLCGSFWYFF